MTLQRPSETSGDAVVTWTTVAKVWAKREGLQGVARSGLTADADYQVTMRYRNDVTPKMRLVEGTRAFAIVSPPTDPDGRREALTFLATEMV